MLAGWHTFKSWLTPTATTLESTLNLSCQMAKFTWADGADLKLMDQVLDQQHLFILLTFSLKMVNKAMPRAMLSP